MSEYIEPKDRVFKVTKVALFEQPLFGKVQSFGLKLAINSTAIFFLPGFFSWWHSTATYRFSALNVL